MPETPGRHPGSSAVGILQRFVSGTHVALATYSMVDVEASFLPLSPTRLQLPGGWAALWLLWSRALASA